MKSLLFINACVRENSRTLNLCRKYLDAFLGSHKDYALTEVNLQNLQLKPLYKDTVELRIQLTESGSDHPMFEQARLFANADMIVIGAPYWDFSYPAILKVYIEHIFVNTITFIYDNTGIPKSLCKFEKLVYISTSGGMVEAENCATNYINTVGKFLGGCKPIYCFAQGLDIWGADVEGILDRAFREVLETGGN